VSLETGSIPQCPSRKAPGARITQDSQGAVLAQACSQHLQAHQPKQGSRQSSKQQKEPPTEVPTQHRSAAALKGRSNNAQVEDAPGGFEPKQQPTELGRSLPPPIESPAEADFEDHSKRATMSTLEEAQEEEAPVRDPWDILPVQVAVLPGTKEEEGKRRLITASKDVVVVNETTIKRSAALERWQTEEDLRQIVKVLSECEKKQQLVPLLGVMFETGAPDRMFCLTKFMPGGTVEHLIRSKRPSRHEPWVPPRTKSLRWSLCLARALRYLHLERGIVHGNVRPSNLLLGSDSDDLRLATAPILLPPEHHVIRSSHSLEGVLYTAPEVMTGRSIPSPSSFGSSVRADVRLHIWIMMEITCRRSTSWSCSKRGRLQGLLSLSCSCRRSCGSC